jgi:uncharacterized protein
VFRGAGTGAGRLSGLQPAHAGAKSQGAGLAGRYVQWQHPDTGVGEEVVDHGQNSVESVTCLRNIGQMGDDPSLEIAGTGRQFTHRLHAPVQQQQLGGERGICHIHGLGRAHYATQMEQPACLLHRVIHANRDRGAQLRDEDRIVRRDLETVGCDGNFALGRHPMLYTVPSHSGVLPAAQTMNCRTLRRHIVRCVEYGNRQSPDMHSMKIFFAALLTCVVSQVNGQQIASPVSSIRVTADSVVTAKPDRAHIDVGVLTQERQSQNAATANAKQMDGIMTALHNLLGADADIKTINRALNPDYQYRPIGGKSAVSSYTALNVVRVTVDDLDKVGPVIDAATQAGANHIESVRYTVRDLQVVHSQAVREAALKAKADAETLAGALNLKVLRVVLVDEAADSPGGPGPDLQPTDLRDVPGPAPSAAQPGSFVVTANVTLTVEVGPR